MEQYLSKVEASGRLLIPAALRNRLGLKAGSEMVIEEGADGVLRIQSRDAALRELQTWLRKFDDGKSWSEELIAERRAEAEREARG